MEKLKSWVKPEQHGKHEKSPEQWQSGPLTIKGTRLSDTEVVGLSLEDIAAPEELKRKYPDIYKYLSSFEGRKDITVAEMTIAPARKTEDGSYTPYAQPGKSVKRAALEMARETEESLHELAEAIQTASCFGNARYLLGFSRLANMGERFGFDVFEIAGDAGLNTVSHKWANESYALSGMDAEQAQEIINRRAAALAIINKKKFLERFGKKDSKPVA